MRSLRISAIAVVVACLTACATAPKSESGRRDLEARAESTLAEMRSRDPALSGLLDDAAGYAVFPEIGKGGAIVGAAYGRGVLFQRGQPVGFVELNQAALGALLGGQTFSELIVLREPYDVQRMKTGNFSLGGNVNAVALTTGAAATVRFTDGVAVFIVPRGGLMAELSVSGLQINFQPRG